MIAINEHSESPSGSFCLNVYRYGVRLDKITAIIVSAI